MNTSSSTTSHELLDSAKHAVGGDGLKTNVGDAERYASVAGGAFLLLFGLRRPTSLAGIFSLLIGGGLVHRGLSGHCAGYAALGTDTNTGEGEDAAEQEHAVHVQKTVSIHKPAEELYRYWRDLTNLPRIMDHLESVTVLNEKRSH